MRLILFIVVVLALVGVLVADGLSMYGAHRNAVNFSNEAAEEAVQTYVDTGGARTRSKGSSRSWRPARASNWWV